MSIIKLFSYTTILIFLFSTSKKICAQSKDSIIYVAKYQFNFIYDTLNRNKPLKETMALALGKKASVFFSYDKIQKDSIIRSQYEESIKNGGKTGIDLTGTKRTDPNSFFKFYDSKELFISARLFQQHIIQDKLPDFQWTIYSDTTLFLGLTCNRAETVWKGRTYIAFFARSIPIPDGPYKFNGLPGLIVKISDNKNEVSYELIEFKKTNNYNGIFTIDTKNENAIKTTKKEYNNLAKAMQEDPIGFAKTYMNASGFKAEIPMSNGFNPKTKNLINNPIEIGN